MIKKTPAYTHLLLQHHLAHLTAECVPLKLSMSQIFYLLLYRGNIFILIIFLKNPFLRKKSTLKGFSPSPAFHVPLV